MDGALADGRRNKGIATLSGPVAEALQAIVVLRTALLVSLVVELCIAGHAHVGNALLS